MLNKKKFMLEESNKFFKSDEDRLKSYRFLAVKNFNYTWDLIDKSVRTVEEDMDMVHSAHTSRYFWGLVGEPLNFQRGEWQISRVYAILGEGHSALFHAKECLRLTKAHDFKGFDQTFAYEAMARAYYIIGDLTNFDKYFQLGFTSLNDIEDKGDHDYCKAELENIKKA